MEKEYLTIREVIEIFKVEEKFISDLEVEEILCPTCGESPSEKLFSPDELEKLRLAKILVEDMGVNLPGVEVIFQMRKCMFEMRRQFDGILEDVARQIKESFKV